MKRNRPGGWLVGAGGLLCLTLAVPAAFGQATPEIPIYKGEVPQNAGISLTSWGSGEGRDTEEKVYVGSKSIKITTQGRYQGVRLVFTKPLDLKSALSDSNAYLQMAMLLPAPDATSGGGMPGPGGPGSPGSPAGPGGPGYGGGRGRPGGAGGPEGPGGPGGTSTGTKKRLTVLRLVLVTSDEKKTELELPLETAAKVRDDWSEIAIPVPMIPNLKNTSGLVKELQIFGDATATLYLGEARVVHDETPIRVEPLNVPETIAVGDTLTFVASAEGGATPLKYQWDFDETDGIQVDAEGRAVKHKFVKVRDVEKSNGGTRYKERQPYTVTLTVSDYYGLKKPVVVKAKISIGL